MGNAAFVPVVAGEHLPDLALQLRNGTTFSANMFFNQQVQVSSQVRQSMLVCSIWVLSSAKRYEITNRVLASALDHPGSRSTGAKASGHGAATLPERAIHLWG